MSRNPRSKKVAQRKGRKVTENNPMPVAIVSATPTRPLTLEYYPTLRFTNKNASDAINFSIANILNCVVNATSASLLTATFQYVKIRRIRMWAYSLQTSGGGVTNTASISFQDTTVGEAGNSRTYVLTPVGSAPAYFQHKPRADSAFGRWQSGSSGVSFIVTCEDCDIVLELDLTYRNGPGLAQAAITTGTSLVTGAHYFRGLDSLALANTKWPVACEVGAMV